jgi:uncharacterized protein (DUF1015 family)
MSEIRRFRALRPPRAIAAEVASVPYDVIDTTEARALAAGKPRSFLHVIRPEIDLPEGTDLHDDAVYEKGAENFHAFLREGWLLEDPEPGFLVYRLVREGQAQVGVVACCSVDEYDAGLIVKHEKTRPDKEDDRTRHLLTMSAHAEPVFLAHPPNPAIVGTLEATTATEAIVDFTADDGVRHTLWRALDSERLEQLYQTLPRIYVADGHHRTASASRARIERQRLNPTHNGREAYNYFLAVIFPADQLRILPYNRLVADLAGRTPEAFLAALSGVASVWPAADGTPPRRGEVRLYVAGRWHGLLLFGEPEARPADPVLALDITRLQDQILAPLLGIHDPRTDLRIEFVGGGRGTRTLSERVDRGKAAIAFSLYPTSMAELMAVADSGRVMPPKSTWFEPKLRSGLFVHRF